MFDSFHEYFDIQTLKRWVLFMTLENQIIETTGIQLLAKPSGLRSIPPEKLEAETSDFITSDFI